MTTPNARDRGLEALLRRQGHGAGPSEGCLDAETLAAWADGGLDETSRAAAEAHTAGCSRCQALLASIVRTEPAPVPSAAPSLWERMGFRWLVPLTAAVGAVLVWIAVPSQPRPRVADTVAVSQAPAPVPPEHDEPAAPPDRDAVRQASPTNQPVPSTEPPATAGALAGAADAAPPRADAARPTAAPAAMAGKVRADVAVGQEPKLEPPARSD
ncbi:MAG: zf-HC2 domain-containing protein, partial [Acidobacteriota bacterium]|nr:zf-HC2 domain-containing protein [Acidobacteriota bacterium]